MARRKLYSRRWSIEKRWPAAVRFIQEHKLNEFFDGDAEDIGIVMQGGLWNTTLRGLHVLGLADVHCQRLIRAQASLGAVGSVRLDLVAGRLKAQILGQHRDPLRPILCRRRPDLLHHHRPAGPAAQDP